MHGRVSVQARMLLKRNHPALYLSRSFSLSRDLRELTSMYRGFQLVVSGAGTAATAASAAVGPAFSVAAILVEYDTALDAILFRNEVDFMIPRGSNNPVHVIRRGVLARINIIRAVAQVQVQVQVLRDEMTLSSSTAEPVSQAGPFYYSYACVCVLLLAFPPFPGSLVIVLFR